MASIWGPWPGEAVDKRFTELTDRHIDMPAGRRLTRIAELVDAQRRLVDLDCLTLNPATNLPNLHVGPRPVGAQLRGTGSDG